MHACLPEATLIVSRLLSHFDAAVGTRGHEPQKLRVEAWPARRWADIGSGISELNTGFEASA